MGGESDDLLAPKLLLNEELPMYRKGRFGNGAVRECLAFPASKA